MCRPKRNLRAALPLTTVGWGVQEDTYDGTFHLHCEDVADVVSFAIFADTRLLPPDVLRECAGQIEAVTVEAAFNGQASSFLAGVDPTAPPESRGEP